MKSEATKEAVSSALSTPAQQPNPKTKTGKAAGTRHNGKSKSKLKRRTGRAVTEENEKLRQKPRAGETRTEEVLGGGGSQDLWGKGEWWG
jgi:hypothetical protein